MNWHAAGSKSPMTQSAALSMAALGVVFGDIGTSPLYALQAALGADPSTVTPDHVRGVLSLVFWSLLLVVGVKYISLVMRADHGGEGGVMALLAQAIGTDQGNARSRATPWLIALAVGGAALLYGDGVITPAISVLAAVEGVAVYAPDQAGLVMPLAATIVLLVFVMQRLGSGVLGGLLGPVMVLWFLALATIGLVQIVRVPDVLQSLSPAWAIELWTAHPMRSFMLMGTIVLVITGTEAMFADMGHFGRRAIARAWWWIVLPSLLLSYLGQGAVALGAGHNMGTMLAHPFYASVPDGFVLPMTILGTIAAVIAAQAVITGAFSLTRQVIQQRLLPPVRVRHTSHNVEGQVYLPAVNRLMCLASLAIVVAFGSSAALADAYGLAVSGMFVVTTLLFGVVARRVWRWSWLKLGPLLGFFLVVDVLFVASNAGKLLTGAWLPLAIAAAVVLVIWTWRRGNMSLQRGRLEDGLKVDGFLEHVEAQGTDWTPGTGVFLSGDPEMTPVALRKVYRHMQVLPETIVLLHVRVLAVPYVPEPSQVSLHRRSDHVHVVICRIGWRDTVDIPEFVRRAGAQGMPVDAKSVTFWTRREGVGGARQQGLPHWQRALLQFLLQAAPSAADLFQLPARRTMEVVVRGKA